MNSYQSVELLKNTLLGKGFIFHEDNTPNIIGVRTKHSRTNFFDDVLHYITDYEGIVQHFFWPMTTLPGSPYLLSPLNKKGSAIMVPGQYVNSYRLGLHKGKYEALIQVKDVKVYRDNNKNLIYDMDTRTVETGLFGINIHKAGAFAQVIGVNSAGCQVVQDVQDYDHFIELCKAFTVGSFNKLFTYTLVEL